MVGSAEVDPSTLLNWARRGYVDKVKTSLETSEVDVNAQYTERKLTMLHAAASEGTKRMVEHLLQAGARVDMIAQTVTGPATPIELAVIMENVSALEALLPRVEDMTTVNSHGDNLFHMAARHNEFTQVIRMLAHRSKAHPSLIREKNALGQTPLHLAAAKGHDGVVKTIMRLGGDSNTKDNLGHSPLYHACVNNNSEVMHLLLRSGIGGESELKNNLLLHAAAKEDSLGSAEAILEVSPDEHATTDEHLQTPLHIACKNGSISVAKLLVKAGACVDARDKLLQTPVHMASIYGKEEILTLLLGAKARPDECDKYGQTALHHAAAQGEEKIVKMLLQRRANPAKRDKGGRTAAHYAAYEGSGIGVDILRELQKLGVDMKPEDSKFKTPLYLAAEKGHLTVVNFLLENDGEKSVYRGKDDDPLEAARATEHHAIIEAIKRCREGSGVTITGEAKALEDEVNSLFKGLQDVSPRKVPPPRELDFEEAPFEEIEAQMNALPDGCQSDIHSRGGISDVDNTLNMVERLHRKRRETKNKKKKSKVDKENDGTDTVRSVSSKATSRSSRTSSSALTVNNKNKKSGGGFFDSLCEGLCGGMFGNSFNESRSKKDKGGAKSARNTERIRRMLEDDASEARRRSSRDSDVESRKTGSSGQRSSNEKATRARRAFSDISNWSSP